MQDSGCCDNNRTPLFFQGVDIYRFVGDMSGFKHPEKPGTVTVAGKPSVDVPPGTLNAILKQASLKD